MANTVAVMVRETKDWLPDLVEKAKKLVTGPGHIKGVDVSPVTYRD